MPKYSTRQRELLLSYFNENVHEKYTANQIYKALEEKGISKSAVYRNLAQLEQEGKIKRFVKNSREMSYQYVDNCKNYLHICCTKCGKSFHLDGDLAGGILKTVWESEGFQINIKESVLYGVCKACNKK